MRQVDLVGRLEEVGAPGWRQSKIAKLERGEMKRISIDEVLELAAALGVQPARLLGSAGNDDIAITSKTVVNPREFRQWLEGSRPLRTTDKRAYYVFLWSDAELERALTEAPDDSRTLRLLFGPDYLAEEKASLGVAILDGSTADAREEQS
jgi:transcriptional regulator with XRE-family HTH domain